MLLVKVMKVSQVEVPRVVRPGTALGSSQKETQLIITCIEVTMIAMINMELYQQHGGNIILNHILSNLSLQ